MANSMMSTFHHVRRLRPLAEDGRSPAVFIDQQDYWRHGSCTPGRKEPDVPEHVHVYFWCRDALWCGSWPSMSPFGNENEGEDPCQCTRTNDNRHKEVEIIKRISILWSVRNTSPLRRKISWHSSPFTTDSEIETFHSHSYWHKHLPNWTLQWFRTGCRTRQQATAPPPCTTAWIRARWLRRGHESGSRRRGWPVVGKFQAWQRGTCNVWVDCGDLLH